MSLVSQVRHLLKQGKSVEGMVGKAVAHYIEENDIAQRLSGLQKWTVKVSGFFCVSTACTWRKCLLCAKKFRNAVRNVLL